MNNHNQITNLMLGHHALIETLLVVFKDNLKLSPDKYPEIVNSFKKFKWELEKHIFTEERVIFRAWYKEGTEISKIIQSLIKDHSRMLDALDTICNNLTPGYELNLNKFKTLLRLHAEIEETTLYPKLDLELTEKEKKDIIEKINEIPVKK